MRKKKKRWTDKDGVSEEDRKSRGVVPTDTQLKYCISSFRVLPCSTRVLNVSFSKHLADSLIAAVKQFGLLSFGFLSFNVSPPPLPLLPPLGHKWPCRAETLPAPVPSASARILRRSGEIRFPMSRRCEALDRSRDWPHEMCSAAAISWAQARHRKGVALAWLFSCPFIFL